jgi:tetratricopeptide (TPR) repeat protein
LVCATWTDDDLSPTIEGSELFRKAGDYLFYLDKYLEAEPLLARALSIKERLLGAKHPTTLKIIPRLAYLYREQGKFEQAESLYLRSIRIWEDHLVVEDPDMPDMYWLLILLYALQGRHEQAEALYQHALSILEQRFGATHSYIHWIKQRHADISDIVHDIRARYQRQGIINERIMKTG